jgi:hypothetical protein
MTEPRENPTSEEADSTQEMELDTIESIEKAITIVCDEEKYLREIYNAQDKIYADVNYPYPFGLWFRGNSRSDYKLIPSVFRRPNDDEGSWYDEGMMISHFRLRNPSYEQSYRSAFDLLCLLQHYEFPTRLLDWTESVLFALYFAVNKNDDYDGKIFVLNANRLNSYTRLHDPETGYICAAESIDVILRSEMAKARRKKDLRYAFEKNGSLKVIKEINSDYLQKYWDTNLGKFEKWLINQLDHNNKDFKELQEALIHPVAVFPNRLNPRMTSQLSMVLIFGSKVIPQIPQGKNSLPQFYEITNNAENVNRFVFGKTKCDLEKINNDFREHNKP